jgi:Tfp pilus assembly protein FimT
MTHPRTVRVRDGLTLVEVVVALAILGGVLITLGMFAVRLSQQTTSSRIRVQAAQLAADRLEAVKGAPRYAAIESLFVATETSIPLNAGFRRQTWVTRVGGTLADTIDYKIVTVQVSNTQVANSATVRKTTTIAPF